MSAWRDMDSERWTLGTYVTRYGGTLWIGRRVYRATWAR